MPPSPYPRCGNSKLKPIFSTFSMQRTYRDVYDNILSDRELTNGMMHDDCLMHNGMLSPDKQVNYLDSFLIQSCLDGHNPISLATISR